MFHQVKEALRVKMANSEYITLVHEATNEDPWGPTGHQMDEIAKVFHNGHEEIMEELTLRLKHRNQSWRSCYKSLLVLDHLARNVHETMIPVISSLVPMIKQISQSFTCNEKGVDRGLSVRERSRKLVELLTDGALLREERQKAEATRRKVAGEPISMGAAGIVSSSHASSATVYDAYEGPRAHNNKPNVALKEEQERADMALALRLQEEEERRSALSGRPLPHLRSDVETSIPVARVKSKPPAAPMTALSQEERDHQLALELQRRLDAGEPITPTVFAHASQSPVRGAPPPSTAAPPNAPQQPARPAPPAAASAGQGIDSLFDFSTAEPSAKDQPPSSQQQQSVGGGVAATESFDPFAHAPPSPPKAPVTETDFFDDFLAQRTRTQTAKTTTAAPATGTAPSDTGVIQQNGTDLFGAPATASVTSDVPPSTTTTPASSDPMFEQQMLGLRGASQSSSNRPTLHQMMSSKAPAW